MTVSPIKERRGMPEEDIKIANFVRLEKLPARLPKEPQHLHISGPHSTSFQSQKLQTPTSPIPLSRHSSLLLTPPTQNITIYTGTNSMSSTTSTSGTNSRQSSLYTLDAEKPTKSEIAVSSASILSSDSSTTKRSKTKIIWEAIKKHAREHHESVNAAYATYYGAGTGNGQYTKFERK
ncbi:hypothetical protein P154DRAFT_622675 [Amniculicola lignicola CBS 123094]|uniref:Uncharacterized protein n=1 Tax=Amniculicola lignicola CBS 123094 TaxID=1392246 RepID=A0A6A5WHB5_9PLEO|nr:hypothetical protein P154DRAFT_622675 [Amniculicola lignicola CBS 123094]